MTGNKLYKNLGALKFEELTKSAGVEGKDTWTTGVSFADVSGDGLLDIYVCYSGKGSPESRKNELWINQGNFKFVEKAEEFGIADPSNSTQSLFFLTLTKTEILIFTYSTITSK
ncbi:VCBS repeat-containing protein [Algoriphagus boritolerans]|uniref:FG-GAP repeat domain-containing protein n=1 Tax=Algoriphagus boritolerans TaxID=308111 RepID=UPI000B15A946